MSYTLNTSANAAFVGQAASTSTTTAINLPSGTTVAAGFYVNGILRFLTGANTGNEQIISANTASSFTVGAFTSAPASGDVFEVILGNTAPSVSQNVASIGGTSQTGADWTPLLQNVSGATGATAAAAPTRAMLLAGSDGTDLRALSVDPSGRLIGAVDLVAMTQIASQAAATDFASFTAPFAGIATVQISLSNTSVLSLSVTPSGGSTPTVSAANSGVELPAGQWQTLSFAISAGAAYALQVANTQTSVAVSIEGAMR